MPSVHDLLDGDERLVYRTRTSWFAPFLASPGGSLCVIGGLAALSLEPLLTWVTTLVSGHAPTWPDWIIVVPTLGGLLSLVFGAMFLGQAFTDRWLQELAVTDRRLLMVDWRARNLARNASGGSTGEADGITSIRLDSMTEVTMEQDLPGIWLGYGTIRVTCAQDDGLVLPHMRRPEELHRVIQEQRQREA